MTQQKFAIYKRNHEKTINDWFDICKKRKIPYVVVEVRTKYADVRFDHISLPNEYAEALSERDDHLIKEATRIFEKYSTKKSRCFTQDLLIIFYDLPPEVAEKAASELYDLITEHLPV